MHLRPPLHDLEQGRRPRLHVPAGDRLPHVEPIHQSLAPLRLARGLDRLLESDPVRPPATRDSSGRRFDVYRAAMDAGRSIHRPDARADPTRERGWNGVADLQGHGLPPSFQNRIPREPLKDHRFTQGDGPILLRVTEPPTGYIRAAGSKGGGWTIPPHAPVDVVVTVVTLVALQLEFHR